MTALDQAFIRAFSQQGTVPVVAARQSPANLPDTCANENGTASGNVAASKAESQPIAVADRAVPHASSVFRDMMATLERPPLRPPVLEKPSLPIAHDSWTPPQQTDTGAWLADWCQTSVGMAEPLNLAQPIVLAESIGVLGSVGVGEPIVPVKPADEPRPTPMQAKQPEPPPAVEDPRSASDDQPIVSENRPSSEAHHSSFPQLPPAQDTVALSEFKPAWQVERFTWPRVCRRLMARAAEEFDRLADALLAASARGQKVLAMAGCGRGEGATTLLLCAARRLAERGVKLVLVDADLGRPRLAKRLGVEPQSGWNELSGHGATFLANAVVESAANNLALSALREPADGHKPGDWSQLAPCLDTLKNHYEMVLVDLGPLEKIESIDEFFGQVVDNRIDAILLVRNPRITTEARLAEVESQLSGSPVALAGMIENFVAV